MGNSTSSSTTIETKHFPKFKTELPALDDKVVAITGCTSGTGLIVAQTSAEKGAKTILMLNRPSERATEAVKTVRAAVVDSKKTTVEAVDCDLQDFESVKKAAARIKSKHKAIDVLCNNAGVMALDDYATKDGYDVQMQTNHLSHFLLTKELFPLLTKAAELRGQARIVQHSSGARMGGPLKPEYFGKNGNGNLGGNSAGFMFSGPKWERYHQTKLANEVFTKALSDKLAAANSKVIASVAAPGLANTNLQTTTAKTGGMDGMMWIMRFSQSAQDGTMPILASCFSKDTANGTFWEPSGMFRASGLPMKVEYDSNSKNKAQQDLLWEESEKACGKFDI